MKELINLIGIFLSHIPKTIVGIFYSIFYKFFNRNVEIGHGYKGLIFNTSHFNKLILFIHGRGGSSSCFKKMADEINKNGEFKDWNMIAIQYEKNSLKDQEKYVGDWIEKSGYDEIIVIGLSKGGLLAVNLSLKFESIKKIITISSPLYGTFTANYFLSKKNKEYKDLSYSSELHKELEHDFSEKNIEMFHIIPKKDFFIYPSSSSFYRKTPPNNIFETDCDHIGLPFNDIVCKKVKSWI